MLIVTFDSNVWRPVGNPSMFPKDPMYHAFKQIHEAIRLEKIEGRLSETIFTLEGIARADRKTLLSNYKQKTHFTEEMLPGGTIRLGLSIGPDQTAHPGNNSYLNSHLKDARDLGFKLMQCPRLAGIVNPDIRDEWYIQTSLSSSSIRNKFGEVSRKIEDAGAGIAWVKVIGTKYAHSSENWLEGLGNAPSSEDKPIASAVAEWADADTVAAHVAYGNHYICTRDMAKSAGQKSVFSPANRIWLERDYQVKFISPEDLGNLM